MRYMPKLSIYKEKILMDLKKQAFKMHKAGMTVREIGKATGKSYTWAWNAVKELESKPKVNKT